MPHFRPELVMVLDMLSIDAMFQLYRDLQMRIEDIGPKSYSSKEDQEKYGWLECPMNEVVSTRDLLRERINRHVKSVLAEKNDPDTGIFSESSSVTTTDQVE